MGQPFIGEIRMFGGSFAPAGWAFCGGQLMPISENDALFTLIGTTYGGDGQETFGLPNLNGRVPMHQGTNSSTGTTFIMGQSAGVESVTITTQTMPIHNHPFLGSNAVANDPNPTNNTLGESSAISLYQSEAPTLPMAASAIGATGGNQPHENMQPYLCVSFIISLFGLFPSQT
jgi:microcystin-dependent protein